MRMTNFVRTFLRKLSRKPFDRALSQDIRELKEGGKNWQLAENKKKQRISPLLLSGLYPPPGTLPNSNY
jgi:hypothetical protein